VKKSSVKKRWTAWKKVDLAKKPSSPFSTGGNDRNAEILGALLDGSGLDGGKVSKKYNYVFDKKKVKLFFTGFFFTVSQLFTIFFFAFYTIFSCKKAVSNNKEISSTNWQQDLFKGCMLES
jgi:hypothetical protein